MLKVYEIPYFFEFPETWGCFPCLILKEDFRRAWINWKGDFVFPPIYAEVGPFVDEIGPFSPDEQFGETGLVRIDGTVVVPPTFRSIGAFVEGLAPASKEKKKFGYINVDGEWVIPPIYQKALSFSDGLACVTVSVPGKRHGLKGFINPKGEMIIPPQFEHESCFHNGWAHVELGMKQAVIDRTGRVIWEGISSWT